MHADDRRNSLEQLAIAEAGVHTLFAARESGATSRGELAADAERARNEIEIIARTYDCPK